MENDGKRTVHTRDVRLIYCQEEFQFKKSCERQVKKKGNQEYRVSGSRNRWPGSSWSK